MRGLGASIAFVITLFVGGCGAGDEAEPIAPTEESKFAEEYLQRFIAGDFEHVRRHVDPEIAGQTTDANLRRIRDFVPAEEPLSVELIGYNVRTVNADWWGNYSFEYHFPSGWAVASVAMRRPEGQQATVIGFDFYLTPASQRELNAFTFAGKSALHYLVVAAAVLVPAFMLVTVYFCIRTPMAKWKWLWVIFILLGVGSFTLNWTTGAFAFGILRVSLLGAGVAAASPNAPWIITVSFPLGAVMFWFRRRELAARSRENKPSPPAPEDTAG